MKTLFSLLLAGTLLLVGVSCKEVQRRTTHGGVNLVIHDQPCAEVTKQVLNRLEKNQVPLVRQGPDAEIYALGPLEAPPLPDDGFGKIEEKGRLEIRCIDPVSTRISLQLQVRGLTPDNRWLEIKDPERLSAYGTRFLEQLVPKP